VGGTAGDTGYDLTVTGPNRFLRRFTGDVTTAGKDLAVEATYYDGRSAAEPKLKLWLQNHGDAPVAFTVTHNNYIPGAPQTVKVAAHSKKAWTVSPLDISRGWYDVTVTADGDAAWSQRFVGHLETGKPSITG
jgi:phospholipase C